MNIGRIENATRVLGQRQGYLGLPIRDEPVNDSVNGPGTPSMVSAWIPNPDEIDRIVRGGPIYLRLLGTDHPPVILTVGEPPS